MGGPADFRGGVVNGDGQSYPLHEGQVRQVIAEKGDFRFLCAGFPQDVFVSGNLVALLLVDKLDVQLLTPSAQSRAAASGNDARPQPGGDGKREALAVVGVKRLAFESRTIRLRQ